MNTSTIIKLQQIIEISNKFDLSLSIDRRDSSFIKNYMKKSIPIHCIVIKASQTENRDFEIILVENDSIDKAVSLAYNKLQKII